MGVGVGCGVGVGGGVGVGDPVGVGVGDGVGVGVDVGCGPRMVRTSVAVVVSAAFDAVNCTYAGTAASIGRPKIADKSGLKLRPFGRSPTESMLAPVASN